MTAADAIKQLIWDEWTTNFAGRNTAVPDLVKDSNGDPSDDPEDGTGVLVLTNEQDLRVKLSTHDLIEVSYIDNPIQDSGSNSENVVDQVQIKIRISDRDIDDDGLRENVRPRMLGERDSNNDAPTLGGLKGEVKRILNGIRKGYKEWDKSSHTVNQQWIRNTDAQVVFTLDLEIIERNVQQPI